MRVGRLTRSSRKNVFRTHAEESGVTALTVSTAPHVKVKSSVDQASGRCGLREAVLSDHVASRNMELHQLIISCPKTGLELYTGFSMSKQAFDSCSLRDISIKGCPHCGGRHLWSSKDARLEDVQSAG